MVPRVLVLVVIVGATGACEGLAPCRPRTFGRQCGDDGTSFDRCVRHESPPDCQGDCDRTGSYDVENQACPSWQPICAGREDTAEPDIVCVGERLGPCDAEGFVRCEGLEAVVVCTPREDGALIESRGPCGADHACLPPGAGGTDWTGGCRPLSLPAEAR